MVMIGEEKRIQALFHEQKLEDGCMAPQFAAMWDRARAESIHPPRAFNLLFAAVTALLVVALFSVALWLRLGRQTRQQSAAIPFTPVVPKVNSAPVSLGSSPDEVVPIGSSYHTGARQRPLKLAARQRAEMVAAGRAQTRSIAAVSKWQSPTATLMHSTADDVLTSLPQLNRSVNELKSFLTDTRQ